jgi:hypothetical protein
MTRQKPYWMLTGSVHYNRTYFCERKPEGAPKERGGCRAAPPPPSKSKFNNIDFVDTLYIIYPSAEISQ